MLVIVATELVDNETNDVSHKSMGRCAGGREAGKIEVSAGPLPNAKQIAAAIYDPDVELLRVIFKDNTTENVSTRR